MKSTIFALAFFTLTLPAFGQGVDPLVGTWKLNVEKSTASFPLYKSLILNMVKDGQNVINTADGVTGQGEAFKVIFRHIYDGMPHPTTGTPNYDATTFTRVGNTINAVRFKQGKVVEVGQGVIVPGRTYTFTNEGIDANNQPYHSILVYDRQ
jgi:hypothetical protein